MNVKFEFGKNYYYKGVMIFGILVFVLSNIYFGWNKEAQSGAEKVCDFIWNVSFFGGLFWWMVTEAVRDEIKKIKIIKIEK